MIKNFGCVTTKATNAFAVITPWPHGLPVGLSVPAGRTGEMIYYRPGQALVMVEFTFPRHKARAILPADAVKFNFS